MNNELCYIIIVHFNDYEDTSNCIKSIFESSNQNFNIVIVNNNLITESFNKLKKTYTNNKKISLINLNSNLGYGAGLNRGIKYALNSPDCKYLWLLNNDTYVYNNSLNELIINDKISKTNKIIGSKILNYDKTIQSIGCRLNKYNMLTYHNYENYKNNKDYYDLKNIDYIHGCSMFFNKNIIDLVGYFDEKYFLFYEDVDFCLRAKSKDIKLTIAQKSVILHKENSSVNKTNFRYLSTVNRLIISRKFFKKYLHFVYLFILIDLVKNLLLFRINRNIQIIKYLLS